MKKIKKVYYCEEYDSQESRKCLESSGIELIKIDPSEVNVKAI